MGLNEDLVQRNICIVNSLKQLKRSSKNDKLAQKLILEYRQNTQRILIKKQITEAALLTDALSQATFPKRLPT